MAKRHASLLSFCQSTHKRQRKSEEKASDDQDQESDDQDVQVVDSPEESDGPYLITIIHYPWRVIYSLHSCHTVPYLITIVRYSCRSSCYLHSCYTGPYIITIVHYLCRVSYILHFCLLHHILLLLFTNQVESATTSIPAVLYIIS